MRADTVILNTWYVAGFCEELPQGKLTGQTIASKPLVIWRGDDGKVVAFDGRCMHKRMPLKDGRLLPDGTVECVYHGFCYDNTGACVRIPSQPDVAIPSRAALKPFPVIEQDGLVWVWPGDPARIGAVRPPRSAEVGSDPWASVNSDATLVPANYRLLIENLLDITHFYPLHDGNVGNLSHSQISFDITEEIIDGNATVKTSRAVSDYRQPPLLATWLGYPVVDRIHTHAMLNPGLTRVQMIAAPPGELGTAADRGYVLYHTHTPIDSKRHLWRWSINAHVEHKDPANPTRSLASAMAESFPEVAAQDLWALERQQLMYELPDDGYTEVSVPADRAMLVARKIFDHMVAEERAPGRGEQAGIALAGKTA